MEDLNCLVEAMYRYVGQTVTIFTKSGGISGSGFTGVLVGVDSNCIRLLCDIGAAPSCPIGSNCDGSMMTSYGMRTQSCGCGGNKYGLVNKFMKNPLGSVTVIPVSAIVCFTHNAI